MKELSLKIKTLNCQFKKNTFICKLVYSLIPQIKPIH